MTTPAVARAPSGLTLEQQEGLSAFAAEQGDFWLAELWRRYTAARPSAPPSDPTPRIGRWRVSELQDGAWRTVAEGEDAEPLLAAVRAVAPAPRTGDGDPTPPDDARLAEVERLANAATPGPWRTVTNRPFGPWADKDCEPLAADGRPVLVRNWKEACLNAAYIAACSPHFTLSLLAALASQRAARARAEEQSKRYQRFMRDVRRAMETSDDYRPLIDALQRASRDFTDAALAAGQPEAVSRDA